MKQIKVKASKRDLDKKISQYVFDNKNFVCRNSEDDYHVINEQNGIVAYIHVPYYSTNLTSAWEIVKKIKQMLLPDGDYFEFELHAFGDLCVAIFKHPLSTGLGDKIFPYWYESWAYNPAEAICQAALKIPLRKEVE